MGKLISEKMENRIKIERSVLFDYFFMKHCALLKYTKYIFF